MLKAVEGRHCQVIDSTSAFSVSWWCPVDFPIKAPTVSVCWLCWCWASRHSDSQLKRLMTSQMLMQTEADVIGITAKCRILFIRELFPNLWAKSPWWPSSVLRVSQQSFCTTVKLWCHYVGTVAQWSLHRKGGYGIEFARSLCACMGFSKYSSLTFRLISGPVHKCVTVSVVCLFMSALQ